MMKIIKTFTLVIAVSVCIVSCNQQDNLDIQDGLNPTINQATLSIPTSSPTTIPVFTATSTPQPTLPPPTITPTDIPRIPDSTNGISSSGPWFSFWDDDREMSRLFFTNPDGSGKIEFARCTDCAWPDISENSPYISYVRTNFNAVLNKGEKPVAELEIIELPSFERVVTINLISNESLSEIDDLGQSNLFDIVRLSWPSWSPAGSKVAFVAAIDAPNLDLYTYDVLTGEISRLSSGPNHAADPFWSPDSEYIVHKEVTEYSLGYEVSDLAVWLANAKTGENLWLYSPNGRDELSDWVDDKTLITYTHRWLENAGPQVDIRMTDISSGNTRLLCKDTCESYQPIIDHQNGILIYQKSPHSEWWALSLGDDFSIELKKIDGMYYYPEWSDTLGRYVFLSTEQSQKVDCNGEKGYYYLDLDLSLKCTTIGNEAEVFHSPDSNWAVDSDGILWQQGEVFNNLLEDRWFRRESADNYPHFTAVWRPDSSGVFLYRYKDLFYMDVPDGYPVLVHKGDHILWPKWIEDSRW